MKRKYKIKKWTFISLLLATTLATLVFSIFWAIGELIESKKDREHIRKASIQEQKNILQREVEQALHYIDFTQNTKPNIPLKELQNEILDYLSTIRFGSGGYIFVNKLDGQALIFDGKKLITYRNNLHMKDIHGKDIFTPQIEAFNNKEQGGVMQYYFKRMDSEKPEPKLSFMKGYHKWGWIIGAGDYLKAVDQEIAFIDTSLKRKVVKKIFFIVFLFVFLLIIIFYFSYRLSNYIHKEFEIFQDYYKLSSLGDLLDLDSLRIFELNTIARMSNKMIGEIDNKTRLLANSEDKFRTIAENSADAIFITSPKGDYLYVNKKASEMLGYSYEELTSMNIADIAAQGKDGKKDLSSFQSLLKSGQVFAELELMKKDKSIIPVDLNAVKLPNGTFYGSCRDISQRRKTEEELQKHKTHLEEMVKQRTKELEEKNTELENFNKLFIGREFRIKELKDKLKKYQGKKPKDE